MNMSMLLLTHAVYLKFFHECVLLNLGDRKYWVQIIPLWARKDLLLKI